MQFFQEYGKEIVSLLVPFITWFLNVGLKRKPKLIWTARHSFTFIVREPIHDPAGNVISPSQTVHTASIRVINTGRETANKVELVFNFKPQFLNLWPVRSYVDKTDQDQRHMLIFDNLSPREEIGLEIMSINNDLPALLQVRSAECVAENIAVTWIPQFPKWKLGLARAFLYLGFATSIYLIIALVQILVLKTPAVA